jgi:hypothetical protein
MKHQLRLAVLAVLTVAGLAPAMALAGSLIFGTVAYQP